MLSKGEGRTDVAPDAERAPAEGDQRRLAARAPAGRQPAVARVQRQALQVVDRLGHHHGRRDVGLAVRDRAELLQHVDQRAVGGHGVEGQGDEADGAVGTRDKEVVLERDGEAVEGAFGARGAKARVEGSCFFEGAVEECFR